MKVHHLLMLLAMVCAAGCSTSSTPVEGDYYTRTVHYFSWEPPGIAESLRFRGKDGGTILVWKNFTGRVFAKDDMAIFEGTTRPEGNYKLFAVRDGAHRFEVGNAILAFEAAKENADVPAFVDQHMVDTSSLKGLTNGIGLTYYLRHGVNTPSRNISLSWDELSNIAQRVAVEGQLQKDGSGMSYLEIDYDAKK